MYHVLFFPCYFSFTHSQILQITVLLLLLFCRTEMLESTQIRLTQQLDRNNGHTLTPLQAAENQMQNAKHQLNLMYKCLKNMTKREVTVELQSWGQSWGLTGPGSSFAIKDLGVLVGGQV